MFDSRALNPSEESQLSTFSPYTPLLIIENEPSVQSEHKGSYTLNTVPYLDSASDWLDFADGIETFLIMSDKLDWLENHEDRPAGNGAIAREWAKRHKFAVYAMRARYNYNVKQLIEGITSY